MKTISALVGRVIETTNHYNGKTVWVLGGLGQPLDGIVLAVGRAGLTIHEEVWESLASLNDRREAKGLPIIRANW